MDYVYLDLIKAELVDGPGENVVKIKAGSERNRGLAMEDESYFFTYFNVMYGMAYHNKSKDHPRYSLVEPSFLDVSLVELIVSAIIQGIAWKIFEESILSPFLNDRKTAQKFKKITKKTTTTIDTEKYKKIYEYIEEAYEPIDGADKNLPPHKKIKKKVETLIKK